MILFVAVLTLSILILYNSNFFSTTHEQKIDPSLLSESAISMVQYCFNQKSIKNIVRKNINDIEIVKEEIEAPFLKMMNFLHEDDVKNIFLLSQCVQLHDAGRFTSRYFGFGNYSGNNVTYMTGFAQRVMPEFVEYVVQIAQRTAIVAGWRPLPSLLGIRCVELIGYVPGTRLGYHADVGSFYTITALLNDHNDFKGGEFHIQGWEEDDGSTTTWTVHHRHMSGIMFYSESMHMVKEVTEGKRYVFCLELWNHADSSKDRPGQEVVKFLPPLVQDLKFNKGNPLISN
jgi:uncharacterized membrane protein